eukprot:738599_1
MFNCVPKDIRIRCWLARPNINRKIYFQWHSRSSYMDMLNIPNEERPDDIELEPERVEVGHTARNPSSSRSVIIGSLLVFASQFCWGTVDSLVKISGLPESQILISRYLIQLICAIVWWNLSRNKHISQHWYGDQPYIINIWLRGFLYFASLLCGYYGLLRLPVGDELAIFYQGPLVTVLLSWLYLHESLPKLCIFIPSLLLTGFGILILAQPPFLLKFIANDDYEPLDAIAICATSIGMFCWALCNILIRKAVRSHWLQLELSTSLQSVMVWIPLCALLNRLFIHDEYFDGSGWLFDISSLMYMMCIGVGGFSAMALLVIGYQCAEATKVAWLENIEIFIAMIYQTFLFNDPPNFYETLGASMVILGCVLPLFEELYNYYIHQKNGYHQVDIDSPFTQDTESE